MYLGSFLRSLFTPRKFLSAIYFLMNIALIFLLFGWLSLFDFGTELDFLWNGLVGLGIHLVILLVSLSPVGEAITRFQMGAKKETDERALKLFQEVYERAGEHSSRLSRHVKLYRIQRNEINAFALGHRTVIVLDGLMSCSDAQIRAVLAHEFGHIANGDSDITLGIRVANSILTVFLFIYTLIVNLIAVVVGILSESVGDIVRIVLLWVVNFVYSLWVGLGYLMDNASSRKQEYAADAFAVSCGYGAELHAFLSALDPSPQKMSLLSLMSSTHPDTVRRLQRIEKNMEAAA